MAKRNRTSRARTARAGAGKSRRFRILSLDGGGIRGVMTAIWLRELERLLGEPIRNRVDLIAGTSTGSILAAALALGMPAAQVVELYRTDGREIFPAPASRRWGRALRTFTQGPSAPRYDDAGLAAVLQREFGTYTLRDTLRGVVGQERLDARHECFVLVTSYNTLTRQATVFKNHKEQHQVLPVWEVVKASCSAPVYFPAHVMETEGMRVPLIDGGVVANNPAACAIAEGVRLTTAGDGRVDPCKLEDFIVGSFGTGSMTRPISIEDAREWGALEWALPVIDVLFDGAADSVDYIAGYLVPEGKYFRFQTPLAKAYDDLDNADATNVNALMNAADHYLGSGGGSEQLRKLAKLL